MSGTSIVRRGAPLVTIVLGAVALALSVAAVRRSAAPSERPFQTPLGDRLPDVALRTLGGSPVSLRERLHGRPALIYVFGAQECASCSNLPLEFKIAQKEVPGLETMLIASGSPLGALQPLVHAMGEGIEQHALVDEHRALLRAFDLAREPLVILVDSAGDIILADTRSASHAAQFPMGHVLRELRAVLDHGSITSPP